MKPAFDKQTQPYSLYDKFSFHSQANVFHILTSQFQFSICNSFVFEFLQHQLKPVSFTSTYPQDFPMYLYRCRTFQVSLTVFKACSVAIYPLGLVLACGSSKRIRYFYWSAVVLSYQAHEITIKYSAENASNNGSVQDARYVCNRMSMSGSQITEHMSCSSLLLLVTFYHYAKKDSTQACNAKRRPFSL